MGEGIGNSLAFLDVILHSLPQGRKWFDFHSPQTASGYLCALSFPEGMDALQCSHCDICVYCVCW